MRRLVLLLPLLILWLAACSEQRAAAPLPKGGDFVLQSADGPVDTLALRGNVLLIYFGYTHCPDVCPASMAAGAHAINALKPEERAKINLIMISVDPERDTPAQLKEYTAFFHPSMKGVTGNPEQVATVAKSFGAGYVRQTADANGNYAVDHTAHTYMVGPDGKPAAVIPLGTSTAALVELIRKHLP